MLGYILLVILFPFISWLLYWFYTVEYYEKYLRKIPGPPRLPLVGNALELASSTTILPRVLKYCKQYGDNFKVYIGAKPYLFISEPKDLEFFLSSTTILTKSDLYRYLHNWLGSGLLTSSGDRWKKHRKIITPAFHFQILEEFVGIFNSAGDILVSKFREASKKRSVDIYPFVARCALDIICETAMGTSVNAQDDLDSEYVKCVKDLLEVFTERSFSPILGNDFLYLFTSTYRKEKYALKVVHDYTRSVINKRKAQFLDNHRNSEENTDSLGRRKKRFLLDLLLEYSFTDPSFTEEHMCEEVDTFMFEGHDTTATSITFTLYLLASNPDVQKKAYAELQAIFSDDPKRCPTYRDLQEMKYLEMVIKEALRIYPSVPMIGRNLEKDLNWNGKLLPKGLMVTLYMYGAFQSSDLYENPERFDPERFSVENSLGRNPYNYVPFSAGPRNCIGQKFAMLEMKSTISNVLRNFELLPTVPDHRVVLKSEAVLKSENGVFIQIKPRNDG